VIRPDCVPEADAVHLVSDFTIQDETANVHHGYPSVGIHANLLHPSFAYRSSSTIMDSPSDHGSAPKASQYAHPLLQLNAESEADLAHLAEQQRSFEHRLASRVADLDASTAAGQAQFLTSLAAERVKLEHARKEVQERQQRRHEAFMAAQQQEWLKTVPSRADRMGADNPWIERASEAKKDFDRRWIKEKETEEARFREILQGLKQVRADATEVFVDLDERMQRRIDEVRRDTEKEMTEQNVAPKAQVQTPVQILPCTPAKVPVKASGQPPRTPAKSSRLAQPKSRMPKPDSG
jgi:hypothetical protein